MPHSWTQTTRSPLVLSGGEHEPGRHTEITKHHRRLVHDLREPPQLRARLFGDLTGTGVLRHDQVVPAPVSAQTTPPAGWPALRCVGGCR